MGKWATGWGVVTACVLGWLGCQKAEPPPEQTQLVLSEADLDLGSPAADASEALELKSTPDAESVFASTVAEELPAPAREQVEEESTSPPPGPPTNNSLLRDEDVIWLSETAESARAGNASIPANKPTEEVTIATATIDGRVKRVRSGTLEVADPEGNIYKLRIDRHSRGLRRGHPVALRTLAAGTPVRASFDLVGGGQSLARDIVLRR